VEFTDSRRRSSSALDGDREERVNIRAFLACLGLLMLSGCCKAPSGWTTFRDPKNGFEVDYPANWYIVPHVQTVFAATNTRRTVDVVSGGNLFSDRGTEFLVSIFPASKVTSLRQINPENGKITRMRLGAFEGEVLQISANWRMHLEFIHNGAFHRVTCESETPKQQERVRNVCEQMLLSIRIL
jgi:hypothetical protein